MQTPIHVTRRATFLRFALLLGLLTASAFPVLANAGNEAASNSVQSFAEKKSDADPFDSHETFPAAFPSLAVAEAYVAAYLPAFIATYDTNGRLQGGSTQGFTPAQGEALLNYAYSSVVKPDLGNVNAGDGWFFRGRGPIQITGRYNTQQFANYVGSHPPLPGQQRTYTANEIMANPDYLMTDLTLAARSAAWYWNTHSATESVYNPTTRRFYNRANGTLNAMADSLTWINPVPNSDRANFNQISRGINAGLTASDNRWYMYAGHDPRVARSRVLGQGIVPLATTGGNPYESLRAALTQLGFTTTTAKDYEKQFGISLQAPQPKKIEPSPSHLMVDSSALPDLVAPFVSQIQSEFEISLEDLNMWLGEPPTPAQEAPIYIAAKATAHESQKKERVFGVCWNIPAAGQEYQAYRAIYDGIRVRDANYYMDHYEKNPKPNFFGDGSRTTVIITKQPAHGRLEFLILNPEYPSRSETLDPAEAKFNAKNLVINYIPEAGYLGMDSYDIEFEQDGVKVKIKNFIVVDDRPNQWKEDLKDKADCEIAPGKYKKYKEGIWKISLLPSQTTTDLASWQRTAELSNILASAVTAVQGFSDLPGLATAQTYNYQITLDTTAAGWGWYLDPTPLDNTDDFLPTADPNIWKAKPGTEADGKMDLLSVLLHEYGHVLGLEHSDDPRDFMGASLQPGERRLPTAAELQLMADLIAQIKAENDALTPSPSPASGRGENNDPLLPIPTRTTTSQTLARRSLEDNDGDDLQIASYLGVVNPTLINGNFSTGNTNGWAAEGIVTVIGNTVTLTESANVQTHLAQAFMVNEGDRYLSFTLNAQNLTSNASGPSDAFEVALLDANTGLPVVGIVNLANTDALLNLQTDGTEYLAASVHKTLNPGGSTTYFIELPDSLAGQAVMLSFDLLGFGAAQSSVTLHKICLLDEQGHIANTKAAGFPPKSRGNDEVGRGNDEVGRGNDEVGRRNDEVGRGNDGENRLHPSASCRADIHCNPPNHPHTHRQLCQKPWYEPQRVSGRGGTADDGFLKGKDLE
ncbi:MAG: matrixin family metalloprotease [Azoarcus sp.]|jgi:hypothetical protein|nr:matrixin family metalloprotease [Azoarcus sp.]